MRNIGTNDDPVWKRGEISGKFDRSGIKFDNLIWYDIDGDDDVIAVATDILHEHLHNPAHGHQLRLKRRRNLSRCCRNAFPLPSLSRKSRVGPLQASRWTIFGFQKHLLSGLGKHTSWAPKCPRVLP